MGILDEDVAKVREGTDFVAVASEHMALRRVGRRWVGLCPFHGEKTPSFSINAEEGFFYCFGCHKGGDVITFVREIEHLEFVEAVEKLAARGGVTLRRDDKQQSSDQRRRQRVYETLDEAITWYHERLLSSPDAAGARGYLRAERGYDGDLVRRYKLGWAPEGWDKLIRAMSAGQHGANAASAGNERRDVIRRLEAAGLVSEGQRGPIDAFRGRVLFPIFEAGGKPVGIGGRILPGGRGPKYKNTSGTAVYDKSRVLYGLNWAKGTIVERERVVVCEGYTDVIALHGAGVGEAVATCGTALADGHVRLLTRFARRIVLAYDADGAGQAAAERVYAWESQFDVDIYVAALPAGADPADVARRDPDELKAAIDGASPFLTFLLERRFQRADLSSPEGRARAAADALAIVDTHPNEIVRDQYLMTVADRCRVDAGQLRHLAASAPERTGAGSRHERPGAGSRHERPGAGSRHERQRYSESDDASISDSPTEEQSGPPVPLPEVEALRLAVHEPGQVADRLELALFSHSTSRAAFSALLDAETLHEAIDAAPPAASRLLGRLAVEEGDANTDDVMVRLLELAAGRELQELSVEVRTSADPLQVAETIAWLKLVVEELRVEDDQGVGRRREAEQRLVEWLVACEEAGR